jgi:hypothetical protein
MSDDETGKFSTPPRSFESIDDARFVPGTILADRYRIIGLLATMTAQLFFFLSVTYPLTTDFSAWYASSTVFALVVALGISVYGFYTSLGGRRVFADRLLGEPLRN